MIMLEAGETDRQLLDHFVHGQDAGAFQSLVLRHGAAVNRVCRGVLNDPHEAEDVFQATFLVLARRAPDIRDPDALEGWLRGVARRIALRARRRAARRIETEKTRAEMSRERPVYSPADGTFDLREIVGSELNRLPDDYRRPIVLCYLDGLTHQEAARRLQWPLGTVKIRLTRGRQMLKERLDRRGVALGAGLLTLLPKGQAAPAVSPALVDEAVRAMSLGTKGRIGTLQSEYARVWEMARRISGVRPVPGFPWIWAVLTAAGILLLGSGVALRASGGTPSPEVDASTLPANLIDVLNVECR